MDQSSELEADLYCIPDTDSFNDMNNIQNRGAMKNGRNLKR